MDKIQVLRLIEERKVNNFEHYYSKENELDDKIRLHFQREILLKDDSLFLNNPQEVDKIIKNFSRFNIKNHEYLYILFISKDVVEKDSYIITFGKIFRNNIQRSCYYNEKKSEKIVNIIKDAHEVNDFKKKEKLLKKARKYTDPRIFHELGLLYNSTDSEKANEYFYMALDLGYSLSGIMLADYLHDKKETEMEMDVLYKSLTRSDYKNTLRLFNLLLENNKPLDTIIQFMKFSLLSNGRICLDIAYELAKLYDEGKLINKDEFAAYVLYSVCGDYKDSLTRINELKLSLLKEYEPVLDKELAELYAVESEKYEQLQKELAQKEATRKKEESKQRRKEAEKQRKLDELRAQYPEKSVDMYNVVDDVFPEWETLKKYDKKVELYKKALENKDSEKYVLIPLIEKAAGAGHTKAMMLLYRYYLDFNEKEAYFWLESASRYGNTYAVSLYDDYKKKLAEEERLKKETLKEAKRLEREKYNEETKNLYEEYKSDINKFKDLFIEANKKSKKADEIIKRCFYHKPLNKEVLNMLNELCDNQNLYAQYYLFDYYLNCKKDNASAGELLKRTFNLDCPYLLNRQAPLSLLDKMTKEPYNELYASIIECLLVYEGDDDVIKKAKAMLYGNPTLSRKYDFKTNFEKKFEILQELVSSKNSIISCESSRHLARMYEYGVGVAEDKEMAIKIYRSIFENELADKLELEIKTKKNKEEREKFKNDLLSKYSHPKFDEFMKTHPKRASEVMNVYLNHCYIGDLEKELIERNKLLDKGIPASKIFEKYFYIKQYLDDVLKKQEEDRLEKLRLEEEAKARKLRLEQLNKELEENNKKLQGYIDELNSKKVSQPNNSSNTKTSTNTTPKKSVNSKLIIHFKSDYNKELFQSHLNILNPPTHSRIIYDDCVRIAKLRASHNCPIEPNKRNYSSSDYKIVSKSYWDAKSRYLNTIYDLKNPIIDNYDAYRRRTWDLGESTKLIASSKFFKLCSEECKKVTGYKISISKKSHSFCDRENKILYGDINVEKMLSYVPLYVKQLWLDVHVEMSYEVQTGSEYNDMYEQFQNSEYSKMMTWEEFTSTKSGYYGDAWQAAYNDRNKQSNYNASKDLQAEKIITNFIKDMFDKYYVFSGDYISYSGKRQYVEGMVKGIRFQFHFHKK